MAYLFASASSQYLTLPDMGTATNGNLTLSAWYWPTNNTGVQSIFGFSDGNLKGLFLYTNSGLLNVNRFSDPAYNISSHPTALTVGAWNHVAVTISGASQASQTLWVNGVKAGTFTLNNITIANTQFFIGTRRYSGSLGDYANGRISELGVWNVALSDLEIASLQKAFACGRVRPQNLVLDLRLQRVIQDRRRAVAVTNNNGATFAAHSRIIR